MPDTSPVNPVFAVKITELFERVNSAVNTLHAELRDVVAQQKVSVSTLDRIVKTFDDPPITSTITRLEGATDANRQALLSAQEGARERMREIRDLQSRMREMEAWRREREAHDEYTRRDLDRGEVKRSGISASVHRGEISAAQISVKMAGVIAVLTFAATAIGGLIVWWIKSG